MTTLAELGRMLIAVEEEGRQLQEMNPEWQSASWYDVDPKKSLVGHLDTTESQYLYRLKPQTKYYRATKDKDDGTLRLYETDAPWSEWVEGGPQILLQEFEVEEA